MCLEEILGRSPSLAKAQVVFFKVMEMELFDYEPGLSLCVPLKGGTSVWTLMMSPLAKNLFQAAVDMSGSYIYNATLEEAERDNLVFLKKTGCTDVSCLRRLSVREVVQVANTSVRHDVERIHPWVTWADTM